MLHTGPLPPCMLLRLAFDVSYVLYHGGFCMLFVIKKPVAKFDFQYLVGEKRMPYHLTRDSAPQLGSTRLSFPFRVCGLRSPLSGESAVRRVTHALRSSC